MDSKSLNEQIKTLNKKIEELQHQNDLYQNILDKLSPGIQIFDKDGVSYLMNEQQRILLGLPDKTTGIGEFNVLTDPFAEATGSSKRYSKVYKGENISHQFEFDLGIDENKWDTRKEKRVIQEDIIPLKDEKGNVNYALAILQDITQRKKLDDELRLVKERFDLALKATLDGLWDWNILTNEVYFSPYWKLMLGYEDNELINEFATLEKLVHPDDLTRVKKYLSEHLEGKKERFDMEFRMKHKNGSWIDILSRATAFFNEKNLPYRMVGTHVDISERKKSEKQLIEMNASKDKLFSIIGHDLRGPFGSIVGLAGSAVERVKAKDFKSIDKLINLIHKSSRQSLDLLDNLLHWAKLQTGRLEFSPENLDVEMSITRAVDFLKSSYSEKNIILYFSIEPSLNFKADRYMLETIVRNLMSNAIKFTDQDGIIRITAKALNDELFVSIKDTGVGVPKEKLEQLFNLEESFTTPGTQNEKGTGLGLILCKEFVDLHGGKIWAESKEGEGSTFSFTLRDKS